MFGLRKNGDPAAQLMFIPAVIGQLLRNPDGSGSRAIGKDTNMVNTGFRVIGVIKVNEGA